MNIEQETKNIILLQKYTDLDHMKTSSVHITKDNWKKKLKKNVTFSAASVVVNSTCPNPLNL
jgi:ABC-type sulfate transport system substrate-binding protein